MLLSDYHTHPQGHKDLPYTQEVLEEWAIYAEQSGLKDVAFTDHGRYHLGINTSEFFKFRDRIKKTKNIYFKLGIEIDNDPESSEADYSWMKKNYDKLDFVLGSVHFIDNWAFDHPSYKEKYSTWNIDDLYSRYFDEMKKLINKGLLDGLAHLDLIKIFGYRPTKEIKTFVKDILKLIKEKNLTIEISTAGLRKPVNELYPQDKIIHMIKELNIPITTASDAHAAKDIGYSYNRLYEVLKQYGFNQVAVFEKHEMKPLQI
ncbi:MAG: histidinol-phosphatase [Candidatus Melainabacteria bacterium]|nr:histidinol-phosphatase [Candidatus Melainabacteria bacterium]